MAYKPTVMFPSQPAEYAAGPVPSLQDWESLWTAWDIITQKMIPHEELTAKPIKLRNACIFYLGHIPTFLDIHLTKATGKSPNPKELEYYQKHFERGIDPDVDNPELCHDHSEVPETWPPAEQILAYQESVRTRVKDLLKSDELKSNGALRKAIWLGFEHETMHLETLLYMLVQSERTVPPVGVVVPDFEALASATKANAVGNYWVKVPARTISLGLDDPDQDLEAPRYFGWDNEKPTRSAQVGAFEAKERAITNGDFAKYLEAHGSDKIPASWTFLSSTAINVTSNGHTNGHTNGQSIATFVSNKAVRTVFGKVPLKFALDWPVMASYDEIAGCARWMGGRIPSLEEAKSIYEFVEEMKNKDVSNRTDLTPAVNSHLVNDGVEETPPFNGDKHHFSSNGAAPSLDPSSLFIDLQSANVGLKSWHPVPVTGEHKLAGQSELGGAWEWTSSVLEKHEGFEPMKLYPGYTADFFDGKHNIVLGGSWATHPRIAGRKSFVNWYQRNYPFVWAGARLVRDL
ncbi:DUF323-domain-containing protein [Microthyrium microscopicum]|uniref:DUF323-domain-containing protein n=1 Tax=Microthyrium microscopicum TaxID=703497 RepID=A0A6A6UHD7_9PEZI|nr:DUF323-domain-containing protein [Microthyrium microscopicum]